MNLLNFLRFQFVNGMVKSVVKKVISKNAPRWIVLLIDIYIVINTFILAYFIRFNFSLNFDISKFLFQIPIVIVAAIIGFGFIGSYKGIIRHSGFRDSINISLASFIILILLSCFVYVNSQFNFYEDFTIPRSILVIHFLLNMITLISSRFLFKELYNLLVSDLKTDKRALIYGAGEAGLLTYHVLRDDNLSKVAVVGFIDDDNRKIGKSLNGLKIMNSKKLTEEFIATKNIDEIIVSIQHIKTPKLLEIVTKLSKLPVEVKIVPAAKTWIEGDLQAKQIKSVKIEDLLGREPIVFENPILKKEYKGNVVLITGAAGSIGSEITRQLTHFKYSQLVLIDQAESDLYNLQQYFINKGVENIITIVADVRNKKRMKTIFKEYKPNFVFHAAAYKHVPFMEENPYEAVCVNVAGTQIIADLALKYHVEKFVMISTDKAVNPTNVMGATKRIAEMYINCLNNTGKTKFITTRFGNVLGSNGSVIPLFKSQIENGGPLTVTHKEITRYFMTIPEACQLVLEAGAMGNGGEIFVFDMGESIKIYELAMNMIHFSGLKYPDDIDIKITGLRPGEKIYEELLANGETTSETYHAKIMIATVKEIDKLKVKDKIADLCAYNKAIDFDLTVLKMKEIVPEFISNNSRYEVLDAVNIKNLKVKKEAV